MKGVRNFMHGRPAHVYDMSGQLLACVDALLDLIDRFLDVAERFNAVTTLVGRRVLKIIFCFFEMVERALHVRLIGRNGCRVVVPAIKPYPRVYFGNRVVDKRDGLRTVSSLVGCRGLELRTRLLQVCPRRSHARLIGLRDRYRHKQQQKNPEGSSSIRHTCLLHG